MNGETSTHSPSTLIDVEEVTEGPEFVGFILHRVPGIDPVYLPAKSGLTVLYGLNGVGKSRILDALRSVWTGEGSGVSALVRIPRSTGAAEAASNFTVNLVRAWLPRAVVGEGFMSSVDGDAEELLGEELWHQLQPMDADVPDPFLGRMRSDRLEALHAEMLKQRLVAVTPSGSAQNPSWTVCFAAVEEPSFPAVSAELRRIRDGYRRLEDEASAPYVVGDYDPDGPMTQYGPEDQLGESAAFEWLGELDASGPLVGLASRGNDRRPHFRFTYIGLDRYDSNGDALRISTLAELAAVGAKAKRSGKFGKRLESAVAELEAEANARYSSVLRDAPHLQLVLRPVRQWFSEDGVEWRFGPSSLGLDAMSTAQRLWADWAIAAALHTFRYRDWPRPAPSLLLMDEPESALHRSAEAHMARALMSYAQEEGRQVIVATHSPELIDLPGARVLEVSRPPGSGNARVSDLRPVDLSALEQLGLNPSDLLRRQRGFLLLEGLHDEVLIKEWIGSELQELRVEVLPLRGGRKLPGTVESRVLFDFSDAHLFVLLDNIAHEEVTDAWVDAQLRYLADGAKAAGDQLRERLGTKPAEREYLGNWLSRALDRGRNARVSPYGLRAADIIEYLPAQALVPGASNWAILRAEHVAAVESGSKRRDFKDWLVSAKKARFTPESLQRAANDTPPPPEVIAFLEVVTKTLGTANSNGRPRREH